MLEMIALDSPGTRRAEDLRLVVPGDGGWWINLAVFDVPINHSRHSRLYGYAEERLLSDIDPGMPFGNPLVPEPEQISSVFRAGSKPKVISLRYF